MCYIFGTQLLGSKDKLLVHYVSDIIYVCAYLLLCVLQKVRNVKKK